MPPGVRRALRLGATAPSPLAPILHSDALPHPAGQRSSGLAPARLGLGGSGRAGCAGWWGWSWVGARPSPARPSVSFSSPPRVVAAPTTPLLGSPPLRVVSPSAIL